MSRRDRSPGLFCLPVPPSSTAVSNGRTGPVDEEFYKVEDIDLSLEGHNGQSDTMCLAMFVRIKRLLSDAL